MDAAVDQEPVTIYRYEYWDSEGLELLTSRWEATLECIRSGLGNPIISSGRQVPANEVDEFGRHIPHRSTASGKDGEA
jgi:hypothetical protein